MWKNKTVLILEEDGGLAEDPMYSIVSGFSFRHTEQAITHVTVTLSISVSFSNETPYEHLKDPLCADSWGDATKSMANAATR